VPGEAVLAGTMLIDADPVAPAAIVAVCGFVARHPGGTAALMLKSAAELSLFVTVTVYVTVAPGAADCVVLGLRVTVGAT